MFRQFLFFPVIKFEMLQSLVLQQLYSILHAKMPRYLNVNLMLKILKKI